jgi:hypothetical protein
MKNRLASSVNADLVFVDSGCALESRVEEIGGDAMHTPTG